MALIINIKIIIKKNINSKIITKLKKRVHMNKFNQKLS